MPFWSTGPPIVPWTIPHSPKKLVAAFPSSLSSSTRIPSINNTQHPSIVCRCFRAGSTTRRSVATAAAAATPHHSLLQIPAPTPTPTPTATATATALHTAISTKKLLLLLRLILILQNRARQIGCGSSTSAVEGTFAPGTSRTKQQQTDFQQLLFVWLRRSLVVGRAETHHTKHALLARLSFFLFLQSAKGALVLSCNSANLRRLTRIGFLDPSNRVQLAPPFASSGNPTLRHHKQHSPPLILPIVN
ncbi:hypothetical protein GX48_00427 [Paracoccidioides brasiliensis]|nr:hypothetical protein GX48_00427 [Paracoccidioides brasiliensis]